MKGKANFSRCIQAVRNGLFRKMDGSPKRWRVSIGDWPEPPSENVSGARVERKTEHSEQKIGWAGAERWADIWDNAWVGVEQRAG